jgi:Tfp pilus assembly protein PilX
VALKRISVTELARRRGQRGAAVFMVVMVLTLVSAIGVFSMRSASLVDLASGYNRQNVQAAFVAEYAARAAATYLQDNPGVLASTTRVSGCAPALFEADANAPCSVLKMSLVVGALEGNGLPGLLSMPGAATSIQSDFVTELTEPGPASVTASPGFVSGQFKQITFTSIARLYPTPTGSTDGVCTAGAVGAVSQQTLRAHAIVLQ